MRLAKNKKSLHLALAALMAVSSLTSVVFVQKVHASAQLTQTLVRFDRMQSSQATTGLVCAKPASTATEGKVKVTFPTGFTVSTTLANWTVNGTAPGGSTTDWPSGAIGWLGIGTATVASGQDVTFPSGDLTAGTLYCFNWTSTLAVSEPASTGNSEGGSVTTQTSVPADIDVGQFSTATITNDQIQVTATVPTAFSFALSANTDALGTLTSGTVKVSPTPVTATVNTNAKNGWLVWAKDASSGLHSSNASYTVASNCTSGAGTNSTLSTSAEGYNTGVGVTQTSGSQTPSIPSVFTGGTTGRGGGLCSTQMQTIAQNTGSSNNAVVTMTNNVNVIASTPAATDYSDTITVVGAGLF